MKINRDIFYKSPVASVKHHAPELKSGEWIQAYHQSDDGREKAPF